MIGRAGHWIRTPSTSSLKPKKMKCSFLDYVELLIVGWAGQWTQTPSTTFLQPRNEMLIFELHSTSDDWRGWSMDSNPIHHPSPAKKMECSFLDYVQLLMISRAGQWIQTPSVTHLEPKKWNAHFWITFNFWWSARLVDGLKRHPPPLSSQKMKCSFLDYVQLLMISQAGWRIPTPSATSFQPKKLNAHFCIMFKFWWSAELVDRLEPHLQPFSNQKNEMLVFVLHYTSDDQPGWSMDSKPIHHPSPAKKWNAHFWITFNFWWSVRLVNGLQPHLQPLSNQKNEMLVFGLCSTSDDQPGWLKDSNPIFHPSPTKKMKCLLLYYVIVQIISRAGQWTRTASTTLLQPKRWNAHFCITFNFWWSARLVIGLKPHPPPPSSQKKWNAHFWIMFNFWWSAGLVDELESHLPPLSSQKNEVLIFGLRSTSDDRLDGSMDLNPICYPSPAKKMKCSFLDYVQLLMIGRAGQWIQTPSTTHLQPKKWNAHFWITFNFWWSARLVDGLKCHPPPLSSQRMKCSFLDYVQLLMISWAGQWTRIPSATPLQTKKMICSFLYYVQLLMISQTGQWTRTPSTCPLKPKNEMLIFGLHSTSDDRLDGRWTRTPSATPLQPKKWNA